MKIVLLLTSMSMMLAGPGVKQLTDSYLIMTAKGQGFADAIKTLLGVKNMNTNEFRGALDNLFSKPAPRGAFAHPDLFTLVKGAYPDQADRSKFYYHAEQINPANLNMLNVGILKDHYEVPLEYFKQLVKGEMLDKAFKLFDKEIGTIVDTADAIIYLGTKVAWSALTPAQQQRIKAEYNQSLAGDEGPNPEGQRVIDALRKAGKNDFADKLRVSASSDMKGAADVKGAAAGAMAGAEKESKAKESPLEHFKRAVNSKNFDEAVGVLDNEMGSYDDTADAIIFVGKQVNWNTLNTKQQQRIKTNFTEALVGTPLEQKVISELNKAGKRDFVGYLSSAAYGDIKGAAAAGMEKESKAKESPLEHFKRAVNSKNFDEAVSVLDNEMGSYDDTADAIIFVGKQVNWNTLNANQQQRIKTNFTEALVGTPLEQKVISGLRNAGKGSFADMLGGSSGGAAADVKNNAASAGKDTKSQAGRGKSPKHRYKPRKTAAQKAARADGA